MDVHQKTYQLTCPFNVHFLVDHCLKADVEQIKLLMGKVEKIEEELRAADVSSEDKPVVNFWVICFISGVIKVDVRNAFVRGDSVDGFDVVIDFEELFFVVESEIEDGDHFEEFLKVGKFFYKKLETLDHHVLGEDHHDFVFELLAEDHVSDGSGNKFFVELFFVFLSGEELLEIVHFMSQLDPAVGIEYIGEVLKFVVVSD
jgi:hypothetical protein